ncbi:MAG: TolC family protein [Polaromonas sp.]|jgi:outer membrane protein TolC
MKTPVKTAICAAFILTLTGCASVNFDQAISDTNRDTSSFTGGKIELSRNSEQTAARAKLAGELLEKPLNSDDAVQLALSNSPAVQTLLAQSWANMSAANQAGRIANPIFRFERLTFKDELELGRILSFGLLDLLTLPRRQAIAQTQLALAQVQLTASVIDQVTQVRQAWVRAVAASQMLQYADQINSTAEASAELARRMQQVGNFNKLQRARQQVFYADSTGRLASAQHAALASREDLVRQLGLTDGQAAQMKLPDRLPDLPQDARSASLVSSTAAEQRLDVQMARAQLDLAGKTQGLNLLTSLVDVELDLNRSTTFDNGSGAGRAFAKRGYELGIRLPVFDWGNARRDAMNARSLAAANRYEGTVRSATSQLRESYSAYRTAYNVARHYRDEVVPLRKIMAEENLLRYNGMLIGVFELLADTRDQISSVVTAINAYQQFWLADAALSASMTGKPTAMMMTAPAAAGMQAPAH